MDDSSTHNWSKQRSPSRTSNTSNQPICRHTSSTCTANLSEGKMVLTYSVLAQHSQQNFLHFNPTDGHTSTCASNISEGKMVLTYSELAANLSQHFNPTDRHTSTCASNIRRTSNTSTQPIGTLVPVHPTSVELPTLQPNRLAH